MKYYLIRFDKSQFPQDKTELNIKQILCYLHLLRR